MANTVLNNAPNMQDKKRRTPEQMYTGSGVQVNTRKYTPFGCPAYVLEDDLQKGNPYHKWKAREKIGIYLGQSPSHSRTVALILNPTTGYVLPQYHFKLDKRFDTVQELNKRYAWTTIAGLDGKTLCKRVRDKNPGEKHNKAIEDNQGHNNKNENK